MAKDTLKLKKRLKKEVDKGDVMKKLDYLCTYFTVKAIASLTGLTENCLYQMRRHRRTKKCTIQTAICLDLLYEKFEILENDIRFLTKDVTFFSTRKNKYTPKIY